MPPRVLQVITDPTPRGAQRFAVDLGVALVELGFVVRTVALGPTRADYALEVPVLGARRLSWATLRALRRELRAADVAVAHGGQTLPACAVAALATRTPFVYRQVSASEFWASTVWRRLRVRAGLRRAARVVCVWDGAAATFRGRFGVDASKLRIIPNAVDARRFEPATARGRLHARRTYGLEPHRFTFVYVGELAPEKSVALAIDAVGHVPDVQLLVVGSGPDAASLHEQAARAAPGRVTFTGRVADPALAYAAADALVLPSKSESMPAVLVEAGLMALPVVATAVEATPTIVRDGETGLLVPVGDTHALAQAVAGLAQDPTRARALGRAARAHCLGRFSLPRASHDWVDVLSEVTAAPGPATAPPTDAPPPPGTPPTAGAR